MSLKKLTYRKICRGCETVFLAKAARARFCSKNCYRRYWRHNPRWVKEEKVRKMNYWRGSSGRASFRRCGNKMELRKALTKMVGIKVRSKVDIPTLYKELVSAVRNNKKKAKKMLHGGFPDAVKLRVEFKIGIDYLRSDQLILDILHGCKGKVRWARSYDSIESVLRGRINKTILFSSYLKYLLSCERTKSIDFKQKFMLDSI